MEEQATNFIAYGLLFRTARMSSRMCFKLFMICNGGGTAVCTSLMIYVLGCHVQWSALRAMLYQRQAKEPRLHDDEMFM